MTDATATTILSQIEDIRDMFGDPDEVRHPEVYDEWSRFDELYYEITEQLNADEPATREWLRATILEIAAVSNEVSHLAADVGDDPALRLLDRIAEAVNEAFNDLENEEED